VTIGTSVLFLVQNNYSHGGDYAVAIVANSSNSSDRETQDTKFGIRAESLGIIDRNVSKRTFEWVVDSDVVDTLSNVSWSCNENLSYSGVTLSNAASLYDYLQYNYSSPGSKTFACTAFGDDGNESKSISFSVDGLSVRSYDVLLTNVSRRIVGFDAHNEYYALETNVSVQSEFANFSRLANISSDESVLVFAELNNTQGAEKEVVVRLSSGNESSNYSAVYALDTVRIEDFNRVDQSNITKVFFYTVRNTWHDGLVSWNLSEPNIVNSTTLANNASVLVMVQHNYSQGEKQPTFIATSAGLSSSLRDAFSVRGIALTDLQVLTGGNTSTTELTIWNYLPNSTTLTWNYDSGVQNITNATSVNHSMLIYVQTNYSMSAVYRTQGLINGSGYTDNRSGVVVS
jgi:hypothetical protein